MNINDIYGGDYLKADHLNGQDVTVQIAGATLETVGQGDEAKNQVVLTFKDKDKRLGLNKTNAETIAAMFGTDCGDWIGRSITLYVDNNVFYQGKRTAGIRIRLQEAVNAKADDTAATPF